MTLSAISSVLVDLFAAQAVVGLALLLIVIVVMIRELVSERHHTNGGLR